jgi:hypothetical protein
MDLTEQVAEFDSANRGELREEQLAYPGFHPVPVKMASVARPSVSDATRTTKPARSCAADDGKACCAPTRWWWPTSTVEAVAPAHWKVHSSRGNRPARAHIRPAVGDSSRIPCGGRRACGSTRSAAVERSTTPCRPCFTSWAMGETSRNDRAGRKLMHRACSPR